MDREGISYADNIDVYSMHDPSIIEKKQGNKYELLSYQISIMYQLNNQTYWVSGK